MAIRAARPGPSTSPAWPALSRAVPGPAQFQVGPYRASPRALPAAQARARGPVSCRASPLEPGTIVLTGPPEVHNSKYISPYSKFNKQSKAI